MTSTEQALLRNIVSLEDKLAVLEARVAILETRNHTSSEYEPLRVYGPTRVQGISN